MSELKKIAIFASGFGSNFQAILDATHQNLIHAEVVLLVVDHPDCYAVERARNSNIKVFSFIPKQYSSKEMYETEIADLLESMKIDLIVLAGYMRLIGKVLLQRFPNKIINIHPALLPSFTGKHAIEQAYNFGVKVFGITVHYVDEGMDTGKIIDQASFHANSNDTLDQIEEKIHALEHQLYPQVIEYLINLS